MFGVNVTDLNVGSKLILSNNQSTAPLLFRETCLIVGLRLVTALLSSETHNTALEPEIVVSDGMWSMFVGLKFVCLIWGHACLVWQLQTGFPVALSWVHLCCSCKLLVSMYLIWIYRPQLCGFGIRVSLLDFVFWWSFWSPLQKKSKAPKRESFVFEVTWSKWVNLKSTRLGCFFVLASERFLDRSLQHKFSCLLVDSRKNVTSRLFIITLMRVPRTATIRSQWSRAAIPSMRRLTSKERTSDSIELWNWWSFLAHPTCWNKRMTFKNAQCSARSRFWVLKISRKIGVLKQSQSDLFGSIAHMTICIHMYMKSIDSGVCQRPWPILWWIVPAYLLTIEYQVVQFLPSISIQKNLRACIWQFSNRFHFFFEMMNRHCMEWILCGVFKSFCSPIHKVVPHISLHDQCHETTKKYEDFQSMVIFQFSPRKFAIRTWFCNCPQHLCLFGIDVECNPSIRDPGKMLVLPNRLFCLVLCTSDQHCVCVIHIHR